MMNKTVLMLSGSCMSFIAGADLCYAGFNPYETPPALSAVMLNSRNSTHTSHLTAAHLSSLEDFAELTLPENSDLSILSLPKDLGSSLSYPLPKDLGRGWGGFHNTTLIQLAAACFVTDTTDCSGNEFAGNNADDDNGGVPPGGDDYDLDDEERCRQEGYTMTDCPEDSDPINFCPYDNTYFEKCKANCPSNYVTCEPPYYGVGEACGDKYASCECTPCSSGYDYTTIPEGYVQDGEACLDCDGKTKYKIKPNPCDGFMDCGSMGPEAGANTCQSGTTTKYDNCKPCPNECSMDSCPSPYTCKKEECSNKYCKNGCQSGYVWNASSKTCTCDPAYKYACDGPDQKGSGQSCNGKYKSCACNNNKTWNGSECVCDSSYQYTCTGANESPYEYKPSCGGKYQTCYCPSDYEWRNGKCLSDICPAGSKKEREILHSAYYTLTEVARTEVGTPCYTKEPINRCTAGSELGYLLYKDMSRAPIEDHDRSKGSPIGIVVCSYPEGGGQAMALECDSYIYWSNDKVENNLTNLPFIEENDEALADLESCDNTAALTAAGDRDTYTAAWRAKEFYPEYKAPETKGKWCLPSAGVMALGLYTIKEFSNDLKEKDLSIYSGCIESEMWTSTLASEGLTWAGRKQDGPVPYISNFLEKEYLNQHGIINPVIEF